MSDHQHETPRHSPPAGVQPRDIPREKQRPADDPTDPRREDGELADMPLSRDPLLNPGPTPD